MGAVTPLAAAPEEVPETSSIGADMAIVGQVLCTGPVHVFGDGAVVRGSVCAHEVTVLGRVMGTIRAVQVKLLGHAAVEGDIFHQQLSIEEEALFDGSSRPLVRA